MSGMVLKHVVMIDAGWLLCVCVAATFAFWHGPKWLGHKAADGIVFVVGAVISVVLFGLVLGVAEKYISITEFLGFCFVALSLSIWFYHQGLKRWANMEYGA